MTRVSVRQARQRLSELIDKAQKGTPTEITRRGRVVARISASAAPASQGLPDLTEFRNSLKVKGSLSRTVIHSRRRERF